MQKKSKIIFILLVISLVLSLVLNLYFAINNYIKSSYTPSLDDYEILGEMTKKVTESEQYQEIASRETVYAIEQGVSRFNVANPSSIFHYEIYVRTEKQTYIFNCIDKFCANVSNEGWTYSRYSEEEPILPLKKTN